MAIEVSTSLEESDYLGELAKSGDLVDAAARDEAGEVRRWDYQSGVLGGRQYALNSPEEEVRLTDSVFSALSIHDHPNFRRTSGLAEFAAIVNGQYVRVRHTDYLHEQVTSTTPGNRVDFLERETVEPPEVPASVLAKPTGVNTDGTVDIVSDTQAKWISEIPANPDRYRADLVFLEVWLEEIAADGSLVDAADSERHADIAGTMLDQLDLNTRLTATGMKDRFENLANRPLGVAVAKGDDDAQVSTQWVVNARVNTVPIGDCAPITATPPLPVISIGTTNPNQHSHEFDAPLTQQQFDDLRNGVVAEVLLTSSDSSAEPETPAHNHTYRFTWNTNREVLVGEDLSALSTGHEHAVLISQGFPGSAPFDEEKARDGVIDNTNRFRMVRDLDIMEYYTDDLDELRLSRYPRFEYVDLEQAMEDCFGLEGNGAFITETYEFQGSDFFLNDRDDPTAVATSPSLNSAKYTRRAVLIGPDAAGRQVIDRGFNDPQLFVALTTHEEVVSGVSYAVPLEVIIRSPIESWNPLGLPLNDVTQVPLPNDGSAGDPIQAAFINDWYFTPAAIWSSSLVAQDPADTATGTKWATGADSNDYEVTASGVWVRDLNGVRTRWPCYRKAQEASSEAVDHYVLRRRLVPLLASIIAGTATVDDLYWLGDYENADSELTTVGAGGTTTASGTGAQTQFSVPHGLGTVLPAHQVWVDGVQITDGWSAVADAGGTDENNSTVTFSAAPPAGTDNVVIRASV